MAIPMKELCQCLVHTNFCHLKNLIMCRRNDQFKSMLNENLTNLTSSCRETLLHRAAAFDNTEIVRFLIASGVPVDCVDQAGQTSLMIAVRHGREDTAILLLEFGANIDVTNAKGESALYMALHHVVYYSVVEAFIIRAKSEVPAIEALVEKLLSVDCCLPYFVFLRDADVLKKLLCRGFDVNSRNMRKETALHMATYTNEFDLVKLLVEHGADVNAIDVSLVAPIYYAAKRLNPAMVEFLLQNNANPETEHNYYEMFPLYQALMEGKSDDERGRECAELLMRADFYLDDPSTFVYEIHDFNEGILRSSRLNSVIAHHVLIEMRGIARWTEEEHFTSFLELKEYYNECRDMLAINVFGTTSLLNLVSSFSDYEMKNRARDRTFICQIELFRNSRPEFKEKYSYYNNTLMKRVNRAAYIVKLENEAISVICDIFGSNYNQLQVFARRVVEYLNDLDLEQLSQLKKAYE